RHTRSYGMSRGLEMCIRDRGFFSLIIPKSYGGREFSAIANSTIVTRIATKSLSVAGTRLGGSFTHLELAATTKQV
ncbi:hypothetical protein, partial [Aeromonas salmonicida]|uniref:hypothetical protein n=1 Tax=Aeromonas salmonicida TaxID=645 RepID=UPI003D31971E